MNRKRKGIVPKNFKNSTKIAGKYSPLGMTLLVVSLLYFFLASIILVRKNFKIIYIPLIIIFPLVAYIITLPNNRYHNFGTKLLIKFDYLKRNKTYSKVIKERK